MLHVRALLAATAVASAFAVAGCGDETDVREEPGELPGTPEVAFRVTAGSALAPFMREGAEFYGRERDVRVEVNEVDAERALEAFCAEEAPLATAPEGIAAAVLEGCRPGGEEPLRVPMAHGAVAVALAAESRGPRCLTVRELRRIWTVGPDPERSFALVGAEPGLPAAELFREVLGGELRDYVAVDGFEVFADLVEEDPDALGFFALRGVKQDVPGDLELVAVDDGDGCVEPSFETVQGGRYDALARELLLFASRGALEREPIRDFLPFLLESHSQFALTGDVVPLSEEEAERALASLRG